MKVLQITEATNVNMSFLKDVTKMVLDKLPKVFPIDTTKTIYLNAIDMKTLLKKYPQKESTIYKFEDLEFVFLHKTENLNVNTYGHYISQINEIAINITAIKKTTQDIKLSELMSATNNSYNMLAVLVHEIRHAMQYGEYDDYFHNPVARSKEYKKRDIEIDAGWHDHLELFNPKDFKTASDYAMTLMASFMEHRDLTDKQLRHYYVKTLKYYSNPEMDKPFKNVKQRRDEFIKEKLPEQIKDALTKKSKILSEFDLRNLPNYSSDKFLLPLRNILPRLYSILNGEPAKNDFQKNMLYLTTALAIPGQTQALKYFAKYMQTVHDYTPQQAISSIENGLKQSEQYTPYDFESIKNYLKSEYRV